MAAAKVEAKLRQKRIVKEFKVWITASVAAATTVALATLLIVPARAQTRKTIADKDDIIGQVLLKVINIIFWFAGFFKEEIVKIF